MVSAADTATAIDEGVKHQVEKLVAELECRLLCTGRGLAGKLVQRNGEIVAGEVEERHEGRRQRAAIVEEVVDGMADVELVDGEGRWSGAGGCCRQTAAAPVSGGGGVVGVGGVGVGG